MRYLVLLVFMVINTNGLFAQTEQHKYEVNPEVVISIEKENTDTLIKWRASLLYKQKEIELINEQVRFDRNSVFYERGEELFDIPSIYKVLLDKDKLFMFIFIKGGLWIYTFDLGGKELNRVKVMGTLPGSIANFGGVSFSVESLDYKDVYYLIIDQSRVVFSSTKMLKLKKNQIVALLRYTSEM